MTSETQDKLLVSTTLILLVEQAASPQDHLAFRSSISRFFETLLFIGDGASRIDPGQRAGCVFPARVGTALPPRGHPQAQFIVVVAHTQKLIAAILLSEWFSPLQVGDGLVELEMFGDGWKIDDKI